MDIGQCILWAVWVISLVSILATWGHWQPPFPKSCLQVLAWGLLAWLIDLRAKRGGSLLDFLSQLLESYQQSVTTLTNQ